LFPAFIFVLLDGPGMVLLAVSSSERTLAMFLYVFVFIPSILKEMYVLLPATDDVEAFNSRGSNGLVAAGIHVVVDTCE
jgi:hypothetical protein